MKIGLCTKPERVEEILRHNFDYAEFSFNYIATLEEKDFTATYDKLQKLGVRSEAFNSYFGSGTVLYGTNANLKAIEDYSDKAMARAKLLGGEVIVLGSGGARRIPEGLSLDEAEEQFCKVVNICGDIAGKYGIEIAIEPLSYRETNYINTLTDGLKAVHKASNKNVGVLVDFFHFFMNGEKLNEFDDINGELLHAHIARPDPSRGVPHPEDSDTLKQWADALKKVGYDRRISFEGKVGEDRDSELSASRPFLEIFR